MKLNIQYFAILKDQADMANETIETTAATPAELYALLKEQYAFTLDQNALKVALNDEFADWDTPLSDGDNIVFIPPVAGG